MAYKGLKEFIKKIEKAGELQRITTRVSRDLEITEITDRISKGAASQNKALLFENVAGFTTPVLINAFGSEKRMVLALGVENLEELRHNLAKLIDLKLPEGFGPAMGRATELLGLGFGGPSPVSIPKKTSNGCEPTNSAATGSEASHLAPTVCPPRKSRTASSISTRVSRRP
jgi:4-hydroxy-3-polyprenylbenzoate decarboxylase